MCTPECQSGHATLSRRQWLHMGLGVAGLAAGAWRPVSAAASAAPLTAEQALQRLQAGNARYRAGHGEARDWRVGRAERAVAQHPFAAILGCADSRVPPELVFDQGAGELFVVRVAGNFVNDDVLASLEYAVQFLKVPLIVVLGHTHCGAVSAALKEVQHHTTLPGHLPSLTQAIRPAVEGALRRHPDDALHHATAHNVQLNVARLATAMPLLQPQVQAGQVRVVGAVHHLDTGQTQLL